jgi:serine/threonine protein kinase/WD40 repeat protein
MNPANSERDPFEKLAETFLARYRAGQRPSISEYEREYPELAKQIRELLPALVLMEQHRPGKADGAAGKPADACPVPRQLGEYHILREVGRGGMGVVYEAVQESLGRHVALKVLPFNKLMDPVLLERFRREARAAAKLHHTNIVPVFGVGEHDGTHYYAMQFIQGQWLDQVLQEVKQLRGKREALDNANGAAQAPVTASVAQSLLSGHFSSCEQPGGPEAPTVASQGVAASQPAGQANGSAAPISGSRQGSQYFLSVARVGVQVAEALAFAHHQGVLHRDVKPSNLLLDTTGQVWVTDFGLAKIEGSDDLTQMGDIVGTLRYMAPERFRAQSDPRSDVYSLGMTLYELLTLRPAFEETDRAQLINRDMPPRPRRLDPLIPRDLETIVLKATAKEPGDRYATAEALAEDLRRFLADRPILARRVSTAEHVWRWCRRNRAVASLSSALVMLLVVLGAGGTVASLLHQERNKALAALERAERAEREVKIRSHLSKATAHRRSGQVGQRFKTLAEIAAAIRLEPTPDLRAELRNEAIAALVLPDLEVIKEWDGLLSSTNAWRFDAGLQRYARAEKGGAVSIRRVEDDAELLRLPGLGPLHDYEGLQFSPDGRFLHRWYQRDGQWRGNLCRIDGAQPVVVLDAAYDGFAFSPDSRQLAASCPNGALCFYDVASGRELRRFPFKPKEVGLLRWNPRSPQLAVHNGNPLRIVHVETGQLLAEWAVPGAPQCVDWHPGGRLLAVNTSDLKISLWDSVTRQPVLPPLEGHKNGGIVLHFHPAGDLLASNDWDGIVRLWDVNTGRQVLAKHDDGWWPQFRTPEGSLLAGGNLGQGKLRLYRCARGSEFRTLLLPNKEVKYSPFLSADGRLLAAPVEGKGIALIDLSDGQLAAEIPVPRCGPFLFEHSGALLTNGVEGLLRWPRMLEPRTGQCRFGPPERLYEHTGGGGGGSTDSRVVALGNHAGRAIVLYRDTGGRVLLQHQEDVRSCAISPNGRWVATGTHGAVQGMGAKVWDAQSGKLVKELPVGTFCAVAFSPDGRWLATGGGGCRLWRVGTWEEGPKVGGGAFAFSPDSRVLAVTGEAGVVRLVDPDSGQEYAREYARLTGPYPIRLNPVCFTPDGAQLITHGSETRAIHIFDLRAIRWQLAELGLDWDLPPIPPHSEG